jgi:hypothetical protein
MAKGVAVEVASRGCTQGLLVILINVVLVSIPIVVASSDRLKVGTLDSLYDSNIAKGSDKDSIGVDSGKLSLGNSARRDSRAVEITLSDPLDCLSQLVCGLNTFPPRVPSQYTAVANDYAYLLRTVIL